MQQSSLVHYPSNTYQKYKNKKYIYDEVKEDMLDMSDVCEYLKETKKRKKGIHFWGVGTL